MDYRILGPLEVLSDGGPVALGARRQREVLALLLMHPGEPLSRDRIVDALWGERPPPTAGKVVQNSVSALRRVLGPAARLETLDGGYALHVAPGELDAERFEQRLGEGRQALVDGDPERAAARVCDALGMWRGPPLADLALEAFTQREIARLEERRALALELRIEADLARGRAADVIADLEALVAEHPLRERLHGQLMLALYRAGRQAEALDVFRDARLALVETLGIEPGPELRRLQDRILAQDPALELLPAPARAGPPPGGRAGGGGAVPLPRALGEARGRPLFGREGALAVLRGAAEVAAAGDRRVVLVSGDAGIGKTRLAAELAAEAHDSGWVVLYGRTDEDGLVPYQPFVEALRHCVAHRPPVPEGQPLDAELVELAGLVPELRRGLADGAPDAGEPDRRRLHDAVAGILVATAADRPLLLVLDDLHWAGRPTLELLRHVLRATAGCAVLVLATHRDTALSAVPALADLRADLRREPFSEQLTLSGLKADGTAGLVASRLDAAATPDLVRRIQDATGGNPFLAEQLVRELAAAHAEDPAAPPEAALERLGVPEGVREVVGRRVERLGERVAEVLVAAAIAGREFRLDVLEALFEPAGDALTAVEHAVDARLVVETAEVDRFAFCHALVRETLYALPTASRRVRLHRRVGEALERCGGARPAELAHHFYAARAVGGAEKAAVYGRAAVGEAAQARAYEQAAALGRRALEALELLGAGAEERRCEARLELASALEQAGEVAESRERYAEAARDARALGLPGPLARAALGFAKWQPYGIVDEPAVALLEDALAALPAVDDPVRASVLGLLAARLDPEAAPERRERLLAEAVAMARRLGDDEALAGVLRWTPYVASRPERIGERLAAAAESVRLAEAAGSRERGLWGHLNRFADLFEQGDVAAADLELDACLRLSRELRLGWFEWYAPTLQATRALFAGRLAEGERLAEEAREARLRHDASVNETHVAQRLALALLRGCPEDADRDVLAGLADRYPGRRVWRAMLVAVDAAAGRRAEAAAGLRALTEGGTLPRLDGLSTGVLLAEACAALGDGDAAARLHGLLAPFGDRHPVLDRGWACWGSLSRPLGRLAATAEDWELADADFRRALRRDRATGAAAWAAHSAHDHAAMLVRRGRPRDRGRAAVLIAAARRSSGVLGLPGLERRLDELAERLDRPGPPRAYSPSSPPPPSVSGSGDPGTQPAGASPPGTQPAGP
jgi:DNA-binding SARP family transcriptional activator